MTWAWREQWPDGLQGLFSATHCKSQPTRAGLFAVAAFALCLALIISSAIVRSKFGKVLLATRDAESRARFLGYRVDM